MAMEPTIFELRDIDKNVVDAWSRHFKGSCSEIIL